MNVSPNSQAEQDEQLPPDVALARFFDVLMEMDFEDKRRKKKEEDDADYRNQLDTNPA